MNALTDLVTNGGPAFPVRGIPAPEGGDFFSPGMTLRDWFAGQALIGMLTCQGADGCAGEYRAKQAYEIADAMLAERAERG